MVTFGQETLFEVFEEVAPLLDMHYRELAKNQDRVHLHPDWDRYADLERIGALVIFTARDEGGSLIGYAAFFASRHPHYVDLMLISNDVLYLHPDHRAGRTGVRLIKHCEHSLEAIYGKHFALTWHAKEGTALASVMPRMGYGVQDIVFSKLY